MLSRSEIENLGRDLPGTLSYTSEQSGNRMERDVTILAPMGDLLVIVRTEEDSRLSVYHDGKVTHDNPQFGEKTIGTDATLELDA